MAHQLLTVDDDWVYREAERDFGLLGDLIARVYFVAIKTNFGGRARRTTFDANEDLSPLGDSQARGTAMHRQ